ncbi:MAG TPA: type II secretion system protein [Gemmataceae bacterium]|nr:type II secretion system protein [Gemmataceae bacterium]
MQSQKRRGFTLAELLVLVVIFGTNLSMLAVGLEKVHNAANRAKCNQGAKQTLPAARVLARVG